METRLRPILAKTDLGAAAALEPVETAADASSTAGGAWASAEAKNEETAASVGRSRTPVALSAEDAFGPARVDGEDAVEGWSPEEVTAAREISETLEEMEEQLKGEWEVGSEDERTRKAERRRRKCAMQGPLNIVVITSQNQDRVVTHLVICYSS